ncbi:MAG: hypothetical protein PHP50_12585 [Lachnospiraceae bacterium]|nr:hypothetical protein [Lachnospiraceae bacterium]
MKKKYVNVIIMLAGLGMLLGHAWGFSLAEPEQPQGTIEVNIDSTVAVNEEINTETDTETDTAANTEIEENYPKVDNAGTDTVIGMDAIGREVLNRFTQISWDQLDPRHIETDKDWENHIIYLAELPEENITLYGYNDEEYQGRGVAIDTGEDVNYFDWYYWSPRMIQPQMYWNEDRKELQVSLLNGTGTGVSVEELHVLQQYETMTLGDYVFSPDMYTELLNNRLEYDFDQENYILTLRDTVSGQKIVETTLDWIQTEEESAGEPLVVEGINIGDQISFTLGDEIWMQFTPGLMINGFATPMFDEMPELEVQVLTDNWTAESGDGEDIAFGIGKQIRICD